MNRRSLHILVKSFSLVVLSSVTLWSSSVASAQGLSTPNGVRPRITAPIENASRVSLQGSQPPRASVEADAGPVSPGMQLQGISIVFSRTPGQQAALDELVAAQQNSASPLYHHWLTPATYAAQFGMADTDIAAVQAWLEQQGFSAISVNNSRNRIYFFGTAAQVASAFGASLHNYTTPASATHPATIHYAPSKDLTIPAALGSSVLAVENISSYRPHPHVKRQAPRALPKFTASGSQQNFLTPADVDTIYDVTPATNAGYTGTGQTIVIVGQSAIETSDLSNFQSAAGLPAKLPTQILVPNSGASTINPGGSTDSDEVESDIDLEYSQAIAQGATIDFVYTGSNTNYGVFDSLQYAVDNQATYPASIISSSYGACEPDLGSTDYTELNAILEQAASQGQSIISAAGDAGSSDCQGEYPTSEATANEQLAADFPGTSQYVTSLGGTEFLLADIAPGSTYFNTAGTSNLIGSAKSYIPEQVWNDDAGDVSLGYTSPTPISSGGGGVSIFTPLPSWQTGVPGIPNSSYRLVPDIALYASPGEPDIAANNFYGGYLYCSSDSTATGVTGSCANGFISSNGEYLTVAGGTSFDAPIFSGMLAIINQATGYSASSGQGVVNPTLYKLAANATTYAAAFHDITSGGNQCLAGTVYCGTGSATTNYAAGTGYDEASGLGSVDLGNLLAAWPTSSSGSGTSTSASSTTTLTAASSNPALGASDLITITVATNSTSVTTTPTGTVSIEVNGTTAGSAITLANGTAQYTFSESTAGSYVVQANYSGDSNYQASSGTITVTVGSSTTPAATFSLSATNVTVAAGSSSTSIVTITPANAYTGTVDFTVSVDAATTALTNACYSISNTAVTSSASVTATLTVLTSSASCSGAKSVVAGSKVRAFVPARTTTSSSSQPPAPLTPARGALLLSGIFLACVAGRRQRWLRLLLCLLMLGTLAGALSGCGSGSSSSSSTNATPGTYTLTITGTDSTNSTINATTTITLTIT